MVCYIVFGGFHNDFQNNFISALLELAPPPSVQKKVLQGECDIYIFLVKNNNNDNSNNNNNNNNNNSSHNENKSSNKSITNNKDNVTSPSPSQNPKEIVFILGDGTVKKLNAFLLTRKFNHKYLVKVRPFRSAKVGCMPSHVKPTVIDFNPDHIIFHCGTNDLSSERTTSQIARSIIELALSLKSPDNKISISLIIPRNDNVNNKVS